MPVRSTIAFCAVFSLFMLLSLAPSCNKAPDSNTTSSAGNRQPASAPAVSGGSTSSLVDNALASGADGKDIFAKANCTMCHGSGLEGGALAPALSGLKANWDADTLKQYLNDPVGYAEADARLAANISKYSMKMPAWGTVGSGDSDLDSLVAWLLEQ